MRQLLLTVTMIVASIGAVPAGASSSTWIAFDSDASGNRDIWMIRADGTGLHQVTTHRAFDSAPVWSPDASRIAFFSDRDGDMEIYSMNIDGTNVVQLTHNQVSDMYPVWSSRNEIAFVSYRDANKWSTPELYKMNADGSGQTRLTFNESQDVYPAWSPDGNRLFYVSNPSIPGTDDILTDGYEIFSMRSDGTDIVRLTTNSCDDRAPSVSPNGTTVAFVTDCEGRLYSGVTLMNTDGTNRRTISPSLAGIDYEDWPTWSPDSSQITFAGTKDGVPLMSTEIYVMDADGSDVRNITNTLMRSEALPVFAPR